MRPLSPKRARQMRLYYKLRRDFLTLTPSCARCGWPATQVHHKRGRVGELLTEVQHFLAVCDGCHRIITDNPTWAVQHGYSLPRVGVAS